MDAEQRKAVVRSIYEGLERGDRSKFAAHLSPDYVWRFPSKASWSRRYEGQADVRDRLLGPLFSLFAGPYTARIINVLAEGDTVVAEIEGHALLKSGGIYDNQYCMLFRFDGDQIVEITEYCDTDLEERLLGPYTEALASYQRGA